MRPTRFPFLLLTLACSTLLFAAGASAQQALPDILLIVDISDPANVTFTATNNTPVNSDSSHSFNDGVSLLNFFTAETEGFGAAVTGTLTTVAGESHQTYNNSTLDDTSGTFADLNLYTTGDSSGDIQTFSTTTQAFTGTAALNPQDFSLLLPAAGYIGDIYAGFDNTEGGEGGESFVTNAITNQVLIGQYMVIPEAGARSWLLAGGALLLAGRFLRRRWAV